MFYPKLSRDSIDFNKIRRVLRWSIIFFSSYKQNRSLESIMMYRFCFTFRYIRLIVVEALRLYPQPPLLIRRALKADVLPGISHLRISSFSAPLFLCKLKANGFFFF